MLGNVACPVRRGANGKGLLPSSTSPMAYPTLTAVTWKLPAFSPCGTHLPAERLGFLARAEVVYGVLDGDEAGRAAAERFGEQLGERWRPIRLPEGCDLNDLGRRPSGRAEFFGMLAAVRRAVREEVSRGR